MYQVRNLRSMVAILHTWLTAVSPSTRAVFWRLVEGIMPSFSGDTWWRELPSMPFLINTVCILFTHITFTHYSDLVTVQIFCMTYIWVSKVVTLICTWWTSWYTTVWMSTRLRTYMYMYVRAQVQAHGYIQFNLIFW